MPKIDHHVISLKFLTAIIMALISAFLFTYVFSPLEITEYRVYNFEPEKIKTPAADTALTFSAQEQRMIDFSAKKAFESKLKKRSFAVMERSKNAVLTVITGSHLGAVNSLREEENLLLNNFKIKLEEKEDKLLEEKRKELENKLSAELQTLRRRVKNKYSDYSQQQIKKNYLKMINLRIGLELLVENEVEKEDYQKKLNEVIQKQEKILAEKNNVLNQEISAKTRTLIMDFNQEYTAYRKQLHSKSDQLLQQKKNKVEKKLAQKRAAVKIELQETTAVEKAAVEKLIKKSKKYY